MRLMTREDPSGPSDARPSGPRSARRAPRAFPAGLVAAAAVLCSCLALLLWLHLIAGPVRLGTGLLQASNDLDQAANKLTAGNTKAAMEEALSGSAGVHRAETALDSTSPLLDVLEAAPKIGPALGEVDHIIAAAEHSATAARGSIDIAANALEGPDSVIDRSGKGSRIRVERIVEIGEQVGDLRGEVIAAQEELAAVDVANLPKRARPQISKALRKAEDAEATLVDADAAFKILPGVLGSEGKRTYLLGFQNSAEARGTGGAILQFRLMSVDDGELELETGGGTGSIYDIDKNREQLDIPLPEDAWYQMGIPDTRRFGNANWSPDFPLSTELLLSYAAAADPGFGPIDGVIAVDPEVIEELIPAVGPIKVPDDKTDEIEKLGKKDIVNYVLNEQYARFPYPKDRRAHLQNLVNEFYTNIFKPKSPTKMLDGLSDSLTGKHMQIWMSDKREQNFIKRMNWDGAIEQKNNSDYLYAIEQNVGGNKLDFFDTQEDKVSIRFDGDDAVWKSRFAITSRLIRPQPRWVMGDSGGGGISPVHRPMLVLYTREDAELLSASVDGTRVDTPEPAVWASGVPPSYLERGKKAWPFTMEALPGETVTAHFEHRVPGIVRTSGGRTVYRLVIQHQPKVHPEWMEIGLRLPEGVEGLQLDGWKRADDGRLIWQGELKKDMTLEVSWRK